MTNREFTPFPILVSERLTLRQLLLNDAENIFAIRSDAEINKYLDRPPSKSIDDAINFINIITENIKMNKSIYWVVAWTETKSFVGTICLFEFSDTQNTCEIGYELLNNFQGKGIMQEAASKVIEYAVQNIKIQTIEAFTHKNNQSSNRLLEKLEFKKSMEHNITDPDYNKFIFNHKID